METNYCYGCDSKENPAQDAEPRKIYQFADNLSQSGKTEDLEKAVDLFRQISGYRDADARVVKCCRLAAEQGNTWAQFHLGGCYYDGRGVEQDYAAAVKWFRLAADQGYANAQYNLGVCYANGCGVEKSPEKALEYYRMAADQGHEQAEKKVEK